MKILLSIVLIIGVIIGVFQLFISMRTSKTETQQYRIIRKEKNIEIRYYPSVILAKISSRSKTYRELGYTGFGQLAKYIFGGNEKNEKIAMTSPVHMDIGDSNSTMSFVMPAHFNSTQLPKPDNSKIIIETSKPEFVAAITFKGFATDAIIKKQINSLKKVLGEEHLSYYGHFRYLGYDPPYQLFGRRNEMIVSLYASDFNTHNN
jgi:hypothetical protein